MIGTLPQLLETMAWPFVACLLLAGIHVYFGIHVLARRVIFVDLALAQLVALGAVAGESLGFEIQSGGWGAWSCSFGAGLLGAVLLTLLPPAERRVSREAYVGIVYAVAMAGTVLLASTQAHGTEQVRGLLQGSILWARPQDLLVAGSIYGAVGLFHYLCRRQILEASFATAEERVHKPGLRRWDFLFYASFALVVANSVVLAGVFLVFGYLMIPAVFAALFAEGVGTRLAIGWTMGGVASAVGAALSYGADLPSGPTIVVLLGATLAVAAVLRRGR